MADAPVRWTKGKASIGLSWFRFLVLIPLWRLATWGFRRSKPLFYHPIALAGLTLLVWSYIVSPWLTAALFWGLLIWQRVWPYSYLRHVDTRIRSFIAGFSYRWKLRKKLTGSRLLNPAEPLPTISWVSKVGCITKVRIKMSYGDDINFWRRQLTAQTFDALDVKVSQFRRETLVPWRHEMVTKPRWLQLEFLTANPFADVIPVNYIDHYLNPRDPLPAIGNPAAMRRDGTPARHPIDRHMLLVGLTGRGKSNALRCHVYADRYAIYAGLLELWGLDGKGGVEIGYMKHLFGRYCFGDGPNDEHFYAETFAALTGDAVRIMLRRLKQIRIAGEDVVHTPSKDDPALRLIVDEMLIFAAEFIPGNVQRKIFSDIALIQRLGRAAKVTVYGCAQDPRKADLPNRGGFTDFRVFKVNDPLDVDLAMGQGAHQRGASSDEIPFDQEGTCYEDTDYGGTPQELRYPMTTNRDIKALPSVAEVLGFQSAFPQFAEPVWTQPPPRASNVSDGAVIIEHDGEPEEVDRQLVAIGAGTQQRPRVRRMRDRARPRKTG